MATVNDLNFQVTLWKDDTKMVRADGNFLIPNALITILNYFLVDKQDFYTHIELRYKNQVVLFAEVADFTSTLNWLTPKTLIEAI